MVSIQCIIGIVVYPTTCKDICNIKASFKPQPKPTASCLGGTCLWKSKPQPWSCKHTKSDRNYPVPDHEYFQPVWAQRLRTLPSWSALLSQSNMLLTSMLYRLYPRHQQPPVCLSPRSHLYGSSLGMSLRSLLYVLGQCYTACVSLGC